MSSIQLINSVVEWERRSEFDEERRKYHRVEPFVNYLATPQPTQKESKSFFARIFGRAKNSQSAPSSLKEKPCNGTQPC